MGVIYEEKHVDIKLLFCNKTGLRIEMGVGCLSISFYLYPTPTPTPSPPLMY